jgi:hypothetical protein
MCYYKIKFALPVCYLSFLVAINGMDVQNKELEDSFTIYSPYSPKNTLRAKSAGNSVPPFVAFEKKFKY